MALAIHTLTCRHSLRRDAESELDLCSRYSVFLSAMGSMVICVALVQVDWLEEGYRRCGFST